jgi:hypothetical protein
MRPDLEEPCLVIFLRHVLLIGHGQQSRPSDRIGLSY